MNNPYVATALASLFAFALPAQAQTPPQAFNPFAMLAPMMTPFGLMLLPANTPGAAPQNAFNPAAMFNPAMLPAMPNFQAPNGMVPFNGLQALPQAYGMPAQVANPFNAMPQPMANPFAALQQPMANPFAAMPQFAMPTLPNQAGFPAFPGFPGFPFPAAR